MLLSLERIIIKRNIEQPLMQLYNDKEENGLLGDEAEKGSQHKIKEFNNSNK